MSSTIGDRQPHSYTWFKMVQTRVVKTDKYMVLAERRKQTKSQKRLCYPRAMDFVAELTHRSHKMWNMVGLEIIHFSVVEFRKQIDVFFPFPVLLCF